MQILEVTELGLRSAALKLKHRESSLHFLVVPMVHMANAVFYTNVTRLLRDVDIVVVEGVRDRSAITMALTATYRVLRLRRVELVHQDVPYSMLGKPLVTPDVSAADFKIEWRKMKWWVRVALWPLLLGLTAIRLVTPRDRLLRQIIGEELNDLPSDLDETLADHPLMTAMTTERDQRLLHALGTLHEEKSNDNLTIAVVYGAQHVPIVVEYLCKRGYFVRSADWLTVISRSR